jgi:predicted DNA-binding transcriptional regulator AlpA
MKRVKDDGFIHIPTFRESENRFSDDRIKGLMTTENVKKLFNISNSTLYRWSSERDVLPKIKIGRKVYFKGEDIERLIK